MFILSLPYLDGFKLVLSALDRSKVVGGILAQCIGWLLTKYRKLLIDNGIEDQQYIGNPCDINVTPITTGISFSFVCLYLTLWVEMWVLAVIGLSLHEMIKLNN